MGAGEGGFWSLLALWLYSDWSQAVGGLRAILGGWPGFCVRPVSVLLGSWVVTDQSLPKGGFPFCPQAHFSQSDCIK
jgi:hypothetical protein